LLFRIVIFNKKKINWIEEMRGEKKKYLETHQSFDYDIFNIIRKSSIK